MKNKNVRRGGMASVQCIFLVGALVGATLFHVWQKVEMTRVASGIDDAHVRIGQLRQERAKLLAAIAIKSNPVYVEQIAVEDLGMVRPSRQPSSPLAHWGG